MENVKVGDFSVNINLIKATSAIGYCPSMRVVNSDGRQALVLEKKGVISYTFDRRTIEPLTGLEDFVASIKYSGLVASGDVLKQLGSGNIELKLPKEAQVYINALIYNRKMLNKYAQEGPETAKLMAELTMLPAHPMKDLSIMRLFKLIPTANAREITQQLKALVADIKYCTPYNQEETEGKVVSLIEQYVESISEYEEEALARTFTTSKSSSVSMIQEVPACSLNKIPYTSGTRAVLSSGDEILFVDILGVPHYVDSDGYVIKVTGGEDIIATATFSLQQATASEIDFALSDEDERLLGELQGVRDILFRYIHNNSLSKLKSFLQHMGECSAEDKELLQQCEDAFKRYSVGEVISSLYNLIEEYEGNKDINSLIIAGIRHVLDDIARQEKEYRKSKGSSTAQNVKAF